MKDGYGRHIDYLRISLTDRCNFRCLYCMPEEGVESLPHGDILTFEEILKIAGIAAGLGIEKIRLTGGEPLVRRGVVSFISALSSVRGIESISMTTNGFFLGSMAGDLKNAGLKRLNISLDSLNRDRFRELTRRDGLEEVLRGIDAAIEAGFDPVKINAVIVRGRNEDEILSLARFAREKNLIIRFIEEMPFNGRAGESFIPASEILKVLMDEFGSAEPLDDGSFFSPLGHGPAEMYRFGGDGPPVGFITPLSNHFCSSCNRIRITADGKLKPCLLSREEIDIRTCLRSECSDDRLKNILEEAILKKPEKHRLTENGVESERGMSKIGG